MSSYGEMIASGELTEEKGTSFLGRSGTKLHKATRAFYTDTGRTHSVHVYCGASVARSGRLPRAARGFVAGDARKVTCTNVWCVGG